jgi:hypothetical protein
MDFSSAKINFRCGFGFLSTEVTEFAEVAEKRGVLEFLR